MRYQVARWASLPSQRLVEAEDGARAPVHADRAASRSVRRRVGGLPGFTDALEVDEAPRPRPGWLVVGVVDGGSGLVDDGPAGRDDALRPLEVLDCRKGERLVRATRCGGCRTRRC